MASGMALHKKWRQTYFSTPSSLTHSAYRSGLAPCLTEAAPKPSALTSILTHGNLSRGRYCDDGQYRQIVTIEDAVSGGCNLFDLNKLRLEYSPPEYQNLLMCEFVDDLASVFPLTMLRRA